MKIILEFLNLTAAIVFTLIIVFAYIDELAKSISESSGSKMSKKEDKEGIKVIIYVIILTACFWASYLTFF